MLSHPTLHPWLAADDAQAFARAFADWSLSDNSVTLEGRVRPDGGFEAWCPALPGVKASGATLVEMACRLRDRARELHSVEFDAENIVRFVMVAAQRAGMVPIVRHCN